MPTVICDEPRVLLRDTPSFSGPRATLQSASRNLHLANVRTSQVSSVPPRRCRLGSPRRDQGQANAETRLTCETRPRVDFRRRSRRIQLADGDFNNHLARQRALTVHISKGAAHQLAHLQGVAISHGGVEQAPVYNTARVLRASIRNDWRSLSRDPSPHTAQSPRDCCHPPVYERPP